MLCIAFAAAAVLSSCGSDVPANTADPVVLKPQAPVQKTAAVSKSEKTVMPDNAAAGIAAEALPAPKLRVKNGSSIVLSDITGYDYYGQETGVKSEPASFLLVNEGTKELIINAITLTGADMNQFKQTLPAFPVVLAPGSSSEFSVVFKPSSKGKKSAQLIISSNDVNWPAFRLLVTGKGI